MQPTPAIPPVTVPERGVVRLPLPDGRVAVAFTWREEPEPMPEELAHVGRIPALEPVED